MGEVVSNIRSELLGLLRGVQLRSDQSSLQDTGRFMKTYHCYKKKFWLFNKS